MSDKVENPPSGQGVDLGRKKVLDVMGKAVVGIVGLGSGVVIAAAVDRFASKSGSEQLADKLKTDLRLLGREVKEKHLGGSPLHIYDATDGFDTQGLTDLYKFPFPFLDRSIYYNLGQGQDAVIRIYEREALERHYLLIAGIDDPRPLWANGNDGYSLTSRDGGGLTYVRNQNDSAATVQELTVQLFLSRYRLEADGVSGISNAQVAKLFASSVGRALALKLNGFSYEDYRAIIKLQGMRFDRGDNIYLYYGLERDIFDKLPQPQNINLFRKTTESF